MHSQLPLASVGMAARAVVLMFCSGLTLCCSSCNSGAVESPALSATADGQPPPATGSPAALTGTPGPFPLPLPSQIFANLHNGKQTSSILTRDASDFVPGFCQRVTPDAPEAILSPAWASGYSPFDTVSYAIYRFDLTARLGRPVIHTSWSHAPGEYKLLWYGASNWANDRWDWYAGSAGGVQTKPDSLALYKHGETSEMYVAVVLLGQSSALLTRVWLDGFSMRGDWWMYGRNATHHACSPFTGPASPALKWRFTLSAGEIRQSAYDANGTLYFSTSGADQSDYLFAYYRDGTQKWVAEVAPLTEHYSRYTSPCIDDDGTIYAVLEPGPLCAFAPDGTQIWAYYGKGSAVQSPALGRDGMVYVISETITGELTEFIAAVDKQGEQFWEYPLGNGHNVSPAVAADGAVYTSNADCKLLAFNPDGSLRWAYQAGARIDGELAIGDGGEIYFADRVPSLNAVSASGSLLWSVALPDASHIRGALALGPDGAIHLSCQNGNLYAFEPEGSVRWSYYIAALNGTYNGGLPVVDSEGNVYVSCADARLYALDLKGALRWWFVADAPIGMQPVIGEDGTLYFSDLKRNFYALGPGGGQQTYSAAGTVMDELGAGIAGVTITITGQEPALTDATGYWSTSGLPDGAYLVSPTKAGYSFSPAFELVTICGGDAVSAGFTGSPAVPAVWPMFGLDRAHTRRSPYTGPAAPALAWRVREADHDVRAEPMICSDGSVIVRGAYGALTVLNADGTTRWLRNLGSTATAAPGIGDDGTIYCGTNTNLLYALLPSGDYKWTCGLVGITGYSSPVFTPQGRLVFGLPQGDVAELDQAGGLSWLYVNGGPNGQITTPAIAPDGTIYYTNGYDAIFALNSDGSEKWSAPVEPPAPEDTDRAITSPAVGIDGTVYVAVRETFYALHLDGTGYWSYTLPDNVHPGDPALGADGCLYFCSNGSVRDNNNLVALNADGSLKWQHHAGGDNLSAAPVLDAGGTLYVGVNGPGGNYVLAVHPDGTQKWRYDTTGRVLGGATLGADGTLYFGDDQGWVYALGPGPG